MTPGADGRTMPAEVSAMAIRVIVAVVAALLLALMLPVPVAG